MKGIILTNAYYCPPDVMYQPERLQEEFSARGVRADIRRNDFFPFRLKKGELQSLLGDYGFCIYLDKDKYVLQSIEKCGMRVYNSYRAIAACDDKMTTCLALSGLGIPMPDTLPGLLCYSPAEKVRKESLVQVSETLGFPLVVKEAYGSLGKGVYLAHDMEELSAIAEKIKCVPHLFQKFIASSYGKDLRVIVVGGRVAGGMLRESAEGFRSNLGAGGSGRSYPVSDRIAALSLKIAKSLGLDYCGIDFLFGEGEEMLVCEVNSNAFFKGFEQATGVNVAGMFAEHVLSDLEKIKG